MGKKDLDFNEDQETSDILSPVNRHYPELSPKEQKSLPQKRAGFRARVAGGGGRSSSIDLVIKIIKCHFDKYNGKILGFSEFLCTVDVLLAFIEIFGSKYTYPRYDATVNHKERNAAIEQFSNTEAAHIILLTARIGGVGVSFGPGSRVIPLDQSWNPALVDQATERVIRYPQEKKLFEEHPYEHDSIERGACTAGKKEKSFIDVTSGFHY